MTKLSSLKVKDIRLTAPNSWEQLSQAQLRYVLTTMTLFADREQVKTYLFIRLSGIKVHSRDTEGWKVYITRNNKKDVFFLSAADVASLLHQFDFIDSYESYNTRLDVLGEKYMAADVLLHDVSFEDYLNAEKYYQLYMRSLENMYLGKMARFLYRDEKGRKPEDLNLSQIEYLNCFLWFSYVKSQFNKTFTHFFKPVKKDEDDEEDTDFDILGSMNAQIRALTGGDITKEKEVLNLTCWRALTELDAKAKEAQEMERISKNMKHA